MGNETDEKMSVPLDGAIKLRNRTGYQRQVHGDFQGFTLVEVDKAIHSLSRGEATGPDGLMAEVYQNLPCLHKPIQALFNVILDTGNIPLPMLKLHIIPLDKAQKGPELCRSKRPISLINAISKALEAAVLPRIMGATECLLDGRQYAYCRQRSTETHLSEVRDFLREALSDDKFVYIAGADVNSAFDNVPHDLLVRTAEDMGISRHICRYMHNWLTRRIFSVRLQTPEGREHSSWRSIGRGLPQGGVLSPYLWLMHMNKILQRVGNERANCPEELEAVLAGDYIHADDILCALAHKDTQTVALAARWTDQMYE